MRSRMLLSLLLLTLGLAGCATSKAPAPVEDQSVGAETQGVGPKGVGDGRALDTSRADLLSQRRVYFAFDSSAIDDESRAVVEAHAAHLTANPALKLRLEGHCDERGTREYNLALGERRAQAVERLARVLGVTASRISTISYGEEKPVASEHDESAWRQNRRVEILY